MRAKMFNVAIRSFLDIFLQVTALYNDNIIKYITFYALPYQNINTEKKQTTMNKEMCILFQLMLKLHNINSITNIKA